MAWRSKKQASCCPAVEPTSVKVGRAIACNYMYAELFDWVKALVFLRLDGGIDQLVAQRVRRPNP